MATKWIPLFGVDTVRTVSQERLDKPDFDAVATLVDEAMQRQIGALVGYGSGVTAPPSVNTAGTTGVGSPPYTVSLGAFQYYISIPTWTDDGTTYKGYRGAFITVDPTASGQSTVIDITAAKIALDISDMVNAMPGIYAQPQQLATDTDARRQWQTSSDAPISMKTRKRIRTVFKVSTASPEDASNTGWALIGQLHWNGTIPDIFWRSWMDNAVAEAHSLDIPPGGTNLDSFSSARSSSFPLVRRLSDGGLLLPGGAFFGGGAQRDLSLVQILTVMRKRFADVIYGVSSSASDWISQVLPTSLATLQTALERNVTVSGFVDFSIPSNSYVLTYFGGPVGWSATVAKLGDGLVTVTVSTPAGATWQAKAALANPMINTALAGSPSVATSLLGGLNGAWFTITHPSIGLGNIDDPPNAYAYIQQPATPAESPFFFSIMFQKV